MIHGNSSAAKRKSSDDHGVAASMSATTNASTTPNRSAAKGKLLEIPRFVAAHTSVEANATIE